MFVLLGLSAGDSSGDMVIAFNDGASSIHERSYE